MSASPQNGNAQCPKPGRTRAYLTVVQSPKAGQSNLPLYPAGSGALGWGGLVEPKSGLILRPASPSRADYLPLYENASLFKRHFSYGGQWPDLSLIVYQTDRNAHRVRTGCILPAYKRKSA